MQSESFGPYRLEAPLGRGPTGERHRAVDTDRDRVVVLEVLPEELSADPGYRERFHRDAALAEGLDEASVVPVHRSGELEGRLYVERPLLAGRDLAAVLAEEGPLEPARAVSVVGRVAAGVDAARGAGLAVGDVPAADVLLGADDAVRLTGLGVPSPAPAGPGDDVAGLAGLLHECLTGSRPTSPGVQPPSAARPGLPPRLDAVVLTGLAEDPAERYRSGAELAAAARSALEGSGGATASGGRRGPRPLVAALAGVVALALVAVVLVVVLRVLDDDGAPARAAPAPTGPVTASPPPADPEAEERLRSIIPPEWIAVDCDPGEPTGDGALAVLGCGSSSGQPGPEDSVFYLYEDPATAEAVFLADMERNGVPPLADGEECPQAQGHGTYTDDDRTGRLACFLTEDNDAIMAWTQDDVGAEGWVVIIDGGQPGLDALWAWFTFDEEETGAFLPR
ncbi:serine/threonine-protein kinase [Trujillonella humicola]|uniref:serine/threonine-protein kinase n=1 Tax=Trujillonella humicola TaxID=3383699 RepID=UPI0039059F16